MVRIGIICPSEIAFRRFLPALSQCGAFRYAGVGVAAREEWSGEEPAKKTDETEEQTRKEEYRKAGLFAEKFGGRIFNSYQELITSPEIDAVYLPLPPALHCKWGLKALENGKHVLVEKPSTVSAADTRELVSTARSRGLAIHENYMFVFHDQLKEIKRIIDSGELGDIRMIRIDFGFPRRELHDFRYSVGLGGGALLDCGGYVLKYAAMLLDGDVHIDYARLNGTDWAGVDIYGSAAFSDRNGRTVQAAFGMDNAYKCDLEVWGSRARLLTNRVLTAPADFVPSCTIVTAAGREERKLPADNAFLKSLQYFAGCIESEECREQSYQRICSQAELVERFAGCANSQEDRRGKVRS